MDKSRLQEILEKVNAYLISPGFPWNFLLEPMPSESLEHYMPYALAQYSQFAPVELEDFLREEIRLICTEFLLDPADKQARAMHGKYALDYPFSYSQCMLGVILENLGIGIDQLRELNQAASLLGFDHPQLIQKHGVLRNLISKYRSRAPKLWLSQLLGNKVISREGKLLGILAGFIYDELSGYIIQLKIKSQRELVGYPRSQGYVFIPITQVRLRNCYSGNILVM